MDVVKPRGAAMWRINAPLGRNGLIGVAVGASAGLGLIAFIVYKGLMRTRRRLEAPYAASRQPEARDTAPASRLSSSSGEAVLFLDHLEAHEVEVQQQALAAVEAVVQGLSPEKQEELRKQLDELLSSVASLRCEVAEVRGTMQGLARQIIQDVKKGMEESQRARRRRYVVHRERTDSMSSSSVYFTASQGAASSYGGDTSEGGYSTAYADSDYTDRDTDREEGDKERESEEEDEEEDEDQSCATVLTLRQEEEEDDEVEEEEEVEEVQPSGELQVVTEAPSGELALLLAQVDILHTGDASLKEEGFRLLLANRPQYGDSREFLWRLARAYRDMYQSSDDREQRRTYAQQGREEAEVALRKNGLNAKCHKWFAVLSGLTSQHDSMHSKLKSNHILKKHLDRAIALQDDDALCFYLLGRWCYEVSSLGWLEKKAAAALYDHPPSSTLHDALENFLKAEELNPGFSKTVRLYIAKCHKELGNLSEARNWAQLAFKMAATNLEEDAAELEAELQLLYGGC